MNGAESWYRVRARRYLPDEQGVSSTPCALPQPGAQSPIDVGMNRRGNRRDVPLEDDDDGDVPGGDSRRKAEISARTRVVAASVNRISAAAWIAAMLKKAANRRRSAQRWGRCTCRMTLIRPLGVSSRARITCSVAKLMAMVAGTGYLRERDEEGWTGDKQSSSSSAAEEETNKGGEGEEGRGRR
ncbi:hypothetical protein CBR_g19383 [Chara braunii]|uniref:Uncharacterized protein n=1 Tax=Chara braunii TaxID=69332 RepID=A0A388KXS1_CHABU|nr:hypothetical protein CBR_g19383 [Chara braunii]|eukprot:GBG74870.1 hypothetical protein CBR_g19383 [Chara braunii]